MMLSVHGPLTSGDHDGNGVPSIFVGAGEWMAGYQPNLSPESNFPLRGNDLYNADPLCAAITSQSLVFFGGADGEVQGYEPDRTFAPGWPFFAGDTVTSTATVAYGTDSMIVLARSTGGYIRGTTQEGAARPPGSWTQFRASAARVNRWDPTGVGAPSPSPASQASETVYAYPNPASRGPVTIRYYLEESSSVDVRIYDLAGNEVTRATTSGIGGMDNEWIWNASGVAPGVYYCRVQATRGGQDVAEFCKVAITP